MVTVLVKHSVENFEAWKQVFDEGAGDRRDAGSKGYDLYNVSEDDGAVVIIMEFDSIAHAKEFTSSTELKERMQEGGVAGEPEIYFLEHLESRSPEPVVA